jgi:signal peptidase
VVEHLTTFVVLTSVVLFVALVLGPRTGAYRTTTMLTGSMAPALPVGALLVAVPVPVAQLRPGDVVTFQAPLADRPVVSHRLVAVEVAAGRPALRTKGDANDGVDPWLAVPESDEAWVVRAVVPGAGTAVRWLRGPVPHLALTVGLPVLLAGWALLLLWRDPDEDEP